MSTIVSALNRAVLANQGRFDDWPSAAHGLARNAVKIAPELASLLKAYDELQSLYEEMREEYEQAEMDPDLYASVDERSADLNEVSTELLDQLVGLLRKEG